LRPANPIYRDVMARTLNARTHDELPPTLANRWMDGQTLDMTELLKTFQQFWRENADAWIERYDYKEAAPHLILQAFLQRVVNGGAQIEREFALGRGRVDICVKYGKKAYPIEVKLAGRPKAESLEQILDYMAACGAKEGWVISFDRHPGRSWDEKISWSTEAQPDGRIVHWVGG
ncbi:MAG: ATP-binding protein, partial [Candidatus Accumulibacter sp.]|nr:ATP-binding protein [Accumulibacter sp.]